MERRFENRILPNQQYHPVKITLEVGGQSFATDIVDYHYYGACLKVKNPDFASSKVIPGQLKINIYLGSKKIKEGMAAEIIWDELDQNQTIGIKFGSALSILMQRKQRYPTNQKLKPTLRMTDPMNPTRQVFASVENFSENGMLISTSLSNRHILPGYRFDKCVLQTPTGTSVKLTLDVSSTRRGKSSGTFELGCAVIGDRVGYKKIVGDYVVALSENLRDEVLKDLKLNEFIPKGIRSNIICRIITTQAEYENVLRLRFEGYKKHDKVKDGATWLDMGEGLNREGIVIAAFLGGKIIGSCEVRIHGAIPFRTEDKLGSNWLEQAHLSKPMELNKLVVHTEFQGTDAIISVLQMAQIVGLRRDCCDVLIQATKKLQPFYKKMGFRPLEGEIIHATGKPELALAPMLLEYKTHATGKGMNPLFWKIIYAEIGQHEIQLGLISKRKLAILSKMYLNYGWKIEPLILKLSDLRRKLASPKSSGQRPPEQIKNKTDLTPVGTKTLSILIKPRTRRALKWITRNLSANVKHQKVIPIIGSILSIGGCYYLVNSQSNAYFLLALCAIFLVGGLIGASVQRIERMRLNRQKSDLDMYQKTLQSKLLDLNEWKIKLHEEVKLLSLHNSLVANLLAANNASGRLACISNSMLKLFAFKNVMILTLNQKKNVLQVAHLQSENPIPEFVWKFEVSLDAKRDSPLFISSSYHSNQSVIISDVESMRFQLNVASQKIIKALNIQNFILVPIPGSNFNWGVIIGEKNLNHDEVWPLDLSNVKFLAEALGRIMDIESSGMRTVSAETKLNNYENTA